MRSKNILCAVFGFLMTLIAAFFGASIHSSKTNVHISHLNELDHIHHFDPEIIPQLNAQAAMFTMPFVLALLFFELWIVFKSDIRQVKNIAIGLTVAALIILVVAILTLMNPVEFDFSQWGYVWITMGIFIVAGNALSIFIKGNAPQKV
ncbi:hypothetical protein OAV92_03135 [Crocinitomicaceae bacterium]|jgi:hypothetical protein|nr:hypothetical protein [Crocinitomicaceae bacterium]